MSSSVNVNRLVHEISPYLRQHSTNPVDWRPWDELTLAEIRKKRLPVFLSIGYSSCHCCHVMERDTFSSVQVANVLNSNFIPVKVDREEYPEIDHLYMNVTRLLTGKEGWPNNLWLTPDLMPFYAGAYFSHDSFFDLCQSLVQAWREKSSALEARGRQVMDIIEQISSHSVNAPKVPLTDNLLRQAVDELRDKIDCERGGFSGIPKFPPHSALRFILRYGAEKEDRADNDHLTPALKTLQAMAAGGIRDHLGGGFHRYVTDEKWLAPRFEKMLYDNALLLVSYSLGWKRTGNPLFRQVAGETADWMLREIRAPEGAFYSSLDSDYNDEEGGFYLWTTEQIEQALTVKGAKRFLSVYGIRNEENSPESGAAGTEETREEEDEEVKENLQKGKKSVLHLPLLIDEYAREHNLRPKRLQEQLLKHRRQLLGIRNRRLPLHRDEKILADWNGLAIYALAMAGGLFSEKRYLDAAVKAAEYFLHHAIGPEGDLAHSLRGRQKPINGYLDDYAFFILGLLELHQRDGDTRWCDLAEELAWRAVAEFADRKNGGFYFTSKKNAPVLRRHRDAFDQATPSGNAVMTECLMKLYQRTRRSPYLEIAERTLIEFSGAMNNSPLSTMGMMTALHSYLRIEQEE